MVKTKLKLENVRQFKTQLMQASPGQIVLAIDNTEEIRVVVLGNLDGDGKFTNQQVGANWVVDSLDGFIALESGSEIKIIQR